MHTRESTKSTNFGQKLSRSLSQSTYQHTIAQHNFRRASNSDALMDSSRNLPAELQLQTLVHAPERQVNRLINCALTHETCPVIGADPRDLFRRNSFGISMRHRWMIDESWQVRGRPCVFCQQRAVKQFITRVRRLASVCKLWRDEVRQLRGRLATYARAVALDSVKRKSSERGEQRKILQWQRQELRDWNDWYAWFLTQDDERAQRKYADFVAHKVGLAWDWVFEKRVFF